MEGIISRYDEELNGVLIDENGISVSIPGALAGERIRYHIEHKSPHQPKAWGRCDALMQPSVDRVKPPCPQSWPAAGACCGCPLMHMAQKLQNAVKKEFVLKSLNQAGITYIRDLLWHPAAETLHYRNRTDLVADEQRGRFVLGSYMSRSHRVVATRTCPILRPPLSQVLEHVVSMAQKLGISAAKNVVQYSGAIRYVSLFANENHEVLIDIVCKSAEGKAPVWLPIFAQKLMEFSQVRGVSYSINDSPNNAIRTQPSQTICGVSHLVERHGRVESLFSASGFTQLNSQTASDIYYAAREWLPSRPQVLWDLYCGAGAFGRIVQPVKALYGAEFSASAINAAIQASQNDEFDTHFEVINLEKTWPLWPEPDVVLVDPPRKGLSQCVLSHLHHHPVPTLIYMSCNPESFAQNAAVLNETYVLERIEAFDMLPQTRHAEVLGMFKRR